MTRSLLISHQLTHIVVTARKAESAKRVSAFIYLDKMAGPARFELATSTPPSGEGLRKRSKSKD